MESFDDLVRLASQVMLDVEINPRFCQACREFLHWKPYPPKTRLIKKSTFIDWGPFFHCDEQMLHSSVLSGCPFCVTIWYKTRGKLGSFKKRLRLCPRPVVLEKLSILVEVKNHRFWNSSHLLSFRRLYHIRSGNNQEMIEVGFVKIRMEPSETFRLADFPPLNPYTGSEQTFEQIRSWLENCSAAHNCGAVRQKDSEYLPSRLVCVENPTRIVERSEVEPGERYLTLSHCWGGARHLTLTDKYLETFQNGLPMERLPETFLDAIVLTRALGIRFIWIDSLCIIQDSEEDWKRESDTMWQVYSNSHLNISATSARNSSEGLFRERIPVSDCSVTVSPGHPFFDAGTYNWYPDGHWDREVHRGPVNQRAWVLQERCLSPRVVHFADSEVFWECHEQAASETFPHVLPPGYKRANRPALYALTEAETKNPSRLWFDLTSKYTESLLTNPSDKLVAIAALARRVSEAYGDTAGRYLAGLWENLMPRQLCWHVDRDRESPVRADDEAFRAPSWSWASVNAPVWPSPVTPNWPILQVRHIDIHGENDYAPVIRGEIHARGPLLAASLHRKTVAPKSHSPPGVDLTLEDMLKNAAEDRETHRPPGYRITSSCAGYRLNEPVEMDRELSLENGLIPEVYLMPVHWSTFHGLQILVLAPTSDNPGHFKRLGIVGINFYNEDLNWLHILGNQNVIKSACVKKSGTLTLQELLPTAEQIDELRSLKGNYKLFEQLDSLPSNFDCYDFCIV